MTCDILGLGAIALDEVLYVDEYPPPDAKVRVGDWHLQCGGLTGNALVAAARMGAACAYAGRLGRSPEAQIIEAAFRREGIDMAHASRKEEDGVVKSTIIVGVRTGTRNVFSRRIGLTGAVDDHPAASVVQSARVLYLDHHGGAGGARAAKLAAAAGIPVVSDFERLDAPHLEELLSLTGHLIVPESFATAFTSAPDAQEAAKQLASSGREATIVTLGPRGCWLVERGGSAIHLPAFEVNAVDTTGCGDVFHGVYAAALAANMPVLERIQFAAAAAAIKATRRGCPDGIPRRHEIETFLADRQGR